MRAEHRRPPFTGTDKRASYPEAFAAPASEKALPRDCKLRRVKYLNNVIEQDHRVIRRRGRAMRCFRSFHTAERTSEGVEAMHVLRKGQVKRLDCSGPHNIGPTHGLLRFKAIFATQPPTVYRPISTSPSFSSPSSLLTRGAGAPPLFT